MSPRDFSKRLRGRLTDGLTLDGALQELRSAGASIVECVAAIRRVHGCALTEAKRLIHGSKAWVDITTRTDAIWSELAEPLDDSA